MTNKYIILLRGVNIGGKNKVSMPKLKSIFEDAGFKNVSTYINSGNIIFSSDISDREILTLKCKELIVDKFGLDIPLIVILPNELAELLANAPHWWDADKEDVNYAIFVIPPMSIEEVFASVGEIKPEYEKIVHYSNVIYWSAPLKTFSKTRWSKIASSSVNNSVTIRNANTTKKLLELVKYYEPSR